ncbi:hypothetical protein HK105_200638 [Polyrhizophydium stewartii]|uniref:Uncharacterized protein n=1 Tax=Polyrhizophydium stewartii TaxID=2732419 RepID=A0ABR4NJT3_9FUNG
MRTMDWDPDGDEENGLMRGGGGMGGSSGSVGEVEDVHSWLGESIIVSVVSCCCVVDAMIIRGRPELAMQYARTARLLLITATAITVILYLVALFLVLLLFLPL